MYNIQCFRVDNIYMTVKTDLAGFLAFCKSLNFFSAMTKSEPEWAQQWYTDAVPR